VSALVAAGLATRAALRLVGYPKSSWYRHLDPPVGVVDPVPQRDRVQPNALSPAETAEIIGWLSCEEYADLSVQQTRWRVLDAGHQVASERSWYRVAARNRLVGDRRPLATHPARVIPELVAERPNSVWSWDITRIPVLSQKTSLHLYLVEDVFSRKAVGWRLEYREQDDLAVEMIMNTITRERARPHTLHSDGGPSMTSNAVKQLLGDQGIAFSKSRPHVSNDNPFSEALFKTLKYDLAHPSVFDDYAHAQRWITAFLARYNTEHRHSGLNGYTPNSVHDGSWTLIAQARQALLDAHYQAHPGRYRRPPVIKTPPGTVWINKPVEAVAA
jgi:putative transposase